MADATLSSQLRASDELLLFILKKKSKKSIEKTVFLKTVARAGQRSRDLFTCIF
jgi:hypothetical protein